MCWWWCVGGNVLVVHIDVLYSSLLGVWHLYTHTALRLLSMHSVCVDSARKITGVSLAAFVSGGNQWYAGWQPCQGQGWPCPWLPAHHQRAHREQCLAWWGETHISTEMLSLTPPHPPPLFIAVNQGRGDWRGRAHWLEWSGVSYGIGPCAVPSTAACHQW